MEDLFVSKILAENLLLSAEKSGLSETHDFGKALRDLLSSQQADLIPYEHYARFYEYCIQSSGDDLFGLHEGEKFNMAALGIVGQIIQVSATVKDGIDACYQHFNLISNVIEIGFRNENGIFSLEFTAKPTAQKAYPLATDHMVLSSMVFAMHELDFLTLKKGNPLQVETTFESKKRESFERVFDCSVLLKGGKNKMDFSASVLDRRIVFADYELLQVLEAVACSRIQKISKGESLLTNTIVNLIYHLLDPAIPSFETVAENLNMSPRSLQRGLNKEGTSFSKIVEEVKKKLAIDYLKKDLSIKEVSYLMGYSEPSAFVSAFKKWFGNTPGQFRLML